jgi:hypothetical protein
MKLNTFEPPHAKRRETISVLQSSELTLYRGATAVEALPLIRSWYGYLATSPSSVPAAEPARFMSRSATMIPATTEADGLTVAELHSRLRGRDLARHHFQQMLRGWWLRTDERRGIIERVARARKKARFARSFESRMRPSTFSARPR